MANNADNLAQMLSCTVCLEDYKSDGAHIPRLLPCTHTLCETCIRELIRYNRLVCPECRKVQEATKGEKSFPQNKYLLVQIHRKKTDDAKENLYTPDKCKKHGKELVLYCTEELCQKSICISCLKTDHAGHKWTEIENQTKEVLLRDVKDIKKNMEAKVEMISKAKRDVFEKTDRCMKELKKTKDELYGCIEQIDKMLEETESHSNETNLLADIKLSGMRTNIAHLNNILINSGDGTGYETIMNHRETVKRIVENNKENLSGSRSFPFPVFTAGRLPVEMVGHMTRGEISLFLPDHEQPQAELPDPGLVPDLEKTRQTLLPRQKPVLSKLKCTGTCAMILHHLLEKYPLYNSED